MPAPKTKQRKYHKGKSHYPPLLLSDSDSVIVQAFHQFRKEMDDKHDKYERIVKLSRDITIESKRLIFSLHALCRSPDPDGDSKKLVSSFQKILSNQFKAISKELEGEDPYQFLRAYSPGLQEYIEAVTLYNFLVNGVLYNWEQLKNDMVFTFDIYDDDSTPSSENPDIKGNTGNIVGTKSLRTLLPLSEYILGIQDLTGELMRFCINSFAAGKVDNAFLTCNFVKILYLGMLRLGSISTKEYWRKQYTFKQSLLKMETACYMMHVRGSEILKDTFTVAIDESPPEEYGIDFF